MSKVTPALSQQVQCHNNLKATAFANNMLYLKKKNLTGFCSRFIFITIKGTFFIEQQIPEAEKVIIDILYWSSFLRVLPAFSDYALNNFQ